MTHEDYMRIAIEYAKEKNPVWPYATLIVDPDGNILIKATNAVHISPTFHGEIVAINALSTEYPEVQGPLTLYTTGECCTMCQSAIHWANILGKNITTVVYGSTIETFQELWGHEINIHSKEVIRQSPKNQVVLIGPILENECDQLYLSAKEAQKAFDEYNSASWQDVSNRIQDYYVTPFKNKISPRLTCRP